MDLQTDYMHGIFQDSCQWMDLFASKFPVVSDITLVGSEMSGALGCALLSGYKGYHFCMVRKPGILSSTKIDVEGWIPGSEDNWIIIDDLIETGRTVLNILSTMSRYVSLDNFQGVYLYGGDTFITKDTLYYYIDDNKLAAYPQVACTMLSWSIEQHTSGELTGYSGYEDEEEEYGYEDE